MSSINIDKSIWQCPHIISFIQNAELKEKAKEEQEEVQEEPIVPKKSVPKPAKNPTLDKLAREEPTTEKVIDAAIGVHLLSIYGGAEIVVCDDCYKIIQSDIVVNILKEFDRGK